MKTSLPALRLIAALAWSVAAPSAAQSPAFDAASVKVNTSMASPTSTVTRRDGHVTITNHSLRLLMAIAFDLDVNQAAVRFVGMPPWSDSQGFDIQAEVAGAPDLAQKRLMLQALLTERFRLATHHETRELPVFALVPAQSNRLGPRLVATRDDSSCDVDRTPSSPPAAERREPRSAADAAALAIPAIPCGRTIGSVLPGHRDQAWTAGHHVTMTELAESIGSMTPLDRGVIIDRTGLTGRFDFTMDWNPQIQEVAIAPADALGVSFRQALLEQLGLKLEPQSGPVDVIVIDRVERPSRD